MTDFQELDRRTIADRIATLLRDAIRTGELTGGTELSQVELARRFGVSRVPVREALRALEGERWVRAPSNQRVIVQDLSLAEMVEAFEVREMLEVHLLQRGFQGMTKAGIIDLRARCDEMQAIKDHKLWVDANHSFHAELMAGAQSTIALGILETVSSQVERYLNAKQIGPERRSEADAEHRAIVEDLAAGDLASAKDRLARHIRRTCELSVQARKRRQGIDDNC